MILLDTIVPRSLAACAVAGLVTAAAGQALASPVRVVAGGPSAPGERAKVQAALEAVAPVLDVCWRGKQSGSAGPVQVQLTMAPDGQVKRAAQQTEGPVAQCVAGVLAVQTLAATGKEYRLTAAFDGGGAAAGGSASGSDGILADLGPYRAQLDACYERVRARSPELAGQVSLRFLIRPDGRITDPEIASSSLGNAEVERCLMDTIKAARVTEGRVQKAVSYSLGLRFAGKANAGDKATAAAPGDTGSDLQPRKEGPMEGAAISAVMDRHKAAFTACHAKQARRNPGLAGRVVLRFTIRDNGSTHNVEIRETTLNHAEVERCMVEIGKTLRFPAQAGREPTRVWYPFQFSSKRE